MGETKLQRKRRLDAELWGGMFNKVADGAGDRMIREAENKNRRVEKRKRAQFRSQS